MAEQNIFKIKKILRDLLSDKFSDAISDPKQTLQDVPYEHLSQLLQRIPPGEYEFLSEEIDSENQDIYEVFVAAKEILDTIANRMSLFSVEKLAQKADKYFKDLNLPNNDAGERDLSDLKRLVRGNLGNYFPTDKPCKHFLAGDLMERYFDECLEEFKKSRSEEFVEVVLKNRKAA